MAELSDFDTCACGDYRKDHKDGIGRCCMPDDLTHGFAPCIKFRLHKAATEIPKSYRALIVPQEAVKGMSGKLHGPYSSDPFACKIYGRSDKDGGDVTVLDIRGWGYLTGRGHGALGMDDNPAFDEQKAFAQRVVDALNAAEGFAAPLPLVGEK